MEQFRLDGRVAVVTGAGGLLGRRHAEALADAGAKVVACDLQVEDVTPIVDQLGGGHHAVSLDVTDEEQMQELTARLHDEIGVPSILVNNAAMNDMVENPTSAAEESRFENYPFELFRKVMDVNVGGMFLCCQAIGGLMAERGSGSIINIASTYGVVAPDQRIYQAPDGQQTFYKSAAYPASKGAVVMLTRFLATYWGERNVRVNALSPGGVENGQPEHFIEQYASRTPLGRMAASTDYQGALVYLASDASRYMTGHNLVVDGGWTTW